MNERRFFNPSQPQTLQIGVLLCYFNAVMGLLGIAASGGAGLLTLFVVIGLGAGGYGIANEKKWGYTLAVAAAVVQVLLMVAFFGGQVLEHLGLLLSFVFDVALVLLLVHPMSRDYQRIWFR